MDNECWQRLQHLFHAAYDLNEPERSNFLNDACAGDPVLLGQVELLLSHREGAKTFIESPALDVVGAALAKQALESSEGVDLVGKTVSHYQIIERLGVGGMGVVYKAEDTTLGRFVALKFLPDVELLGSLGRAPEEESKKKETARFLQEARAASALDHPYICTVYEVGKYKGSPFIAMQFLQGRPLSEVIDGKPCTLSQILQVGLQVADGLGAAHNAGIVHGDVKPANIFVMAARQEVKILDFGLAKVGLGQFRSDSAEPPALLGTAAYMSPEQVRAEELDARSDLFALGVTLYEAATGRLPFGGESHKEVLRAVLLATPPAPSSLNPKLPRTLDTIIAKTLAKDRNSRYQTARELHDDLERLRRSLTARFHQPWLQALAAILLVVTSIGGYKYAQWRESQRLLSSDAIVLADFSNTTGDSTFDETLKQAMRVELEQSPFLHVLSDQQVSQELKYMRNPENGPLTAVVAREVCVRSGATILLTGTVSRLGSQYVVAVSATQCADGASRDSEQSLVSSREAVLHSLVELAANLRAKLGESRTNIKRYSVPLEQVTTSSLEALQSYSIALKTWNTKGEEAAIPFLERATQLDPEFVIAWARLGDAYFNIGRDTNAVQALKKAFVSRDRVGEPERFYIESRYYRAVTHEYEKGLHVDELWRQIYPRDISPYLGAANAYARAGRHEKSLEMEAQALSLDPDNGFIYANVAFIYINLNEFDKAREILARAEERNIYNPWFESIRYQIGFVKKDEEQMQRAIAAVADKPSLQSFFLALQADTEAYAGHLTRARRLTWSAMESARRNNDPDSANGYEIADSLREVEYGIRQRALEEAHAVLAARPSQQVRVLAALALARAGDSASALVVVKDLNSDFPSDTLLNSYWLPTIKAAVELSRHNPSRVIKLLEPVKPYEMGLQPNPTFLVPYPPYLRGLAYLESGKGAEAAEEFQKIHEHAGLVLNCPLGVLAHLQLGRAYGLQVKLRLAGKSNPNAPGGASGASQPAIIAKARTSYEKFLTLWKKADPNIPILKKAKTEYERLH